MLENILKKILAAFPFIAALAYFYFDISNLDKYLYYFIPSLLISILIYYINRLQRKIEFTFIIMLLIQLVADMIVLTGGEDSFFKSISFYFAVKTLLLIYITKKIGVLKPNDILLIFIPFSIALLAIVYLIFVSAGLINLLILIYALVVSMVVSVSINYYQKAKTKSSFLLFIGVSSFLISDIFAGLYQLVSRSVLNDVVSTLAYLSALFFIVKSTTVEIEEINDELQKGTK